MESTFVSILLLKLCIGDYRAARLVLIRISLSNLRTSKPVYFQTPQSIDVLFVDIIPESEQRHQGPRSYIIASDL